MALRLYSTLGNEDLAAGLARHLDATVGEVGFRRFPDGESYLRVLDSSSLRGEDTAIVCTLDHPDGKLLPLLFLADTLKDLGAASVGLVCSYLPYMRQDRRFKPGEAVTSASFANIMRRHIDWLVTVDPHLHRIKTLEELYAIPAAVAAAAPVIGNWIRANLVDPLIVGPDEESAQWASSIADSAGAPFVILKKERQGDRRVRIDGIGLRGVAATGRTPVLVDDIISTGATMVEAAAVLRAERFADPYCVGVHAIFAPGAVAALKAAGFRDVITSNTVAHPTNRIDVNAAIAQCVQDLGKHRR